MNPLVSVCLITFNHAKYIRDALEGVLMQNINFEWEFIIADDFSNDGTREILVDYQKKHPQLIKLILQNKNTGPANNWIDLLKASQAKYTAYFEGDDFWTDRNKLQTQVDFLEQNTDYSMCFHNVEYRYETKNTPSILGLNSDEPETTTSIDLALRNNYIPSCSVVYRNNYSEDFFNMIPHIKIGDWFLHLYNSQFGKIKYISKVMGVYRIHKAGSWSAINDLERQNILIETTNKLIHFFEGNDVISSHLLKTRTQLEKDYNISVTRPIIKKTSFIVKLIKSVTPFYIINKLHFKKTGYYLK